MAAPVVPLVAITRASPASTGTPPGRRCSACRTDHPRRAQLVEHGVLRRHRQALVEWEHGVAAVPGGLEGGDEAGSRRAGRLPPGRGTAASLRWPMSRPANQMPRHPWLAGARPRTLPASAVPVVVGHRGGERRRIGHLVAGGGRPGRGGGPAGRHQLRQRLQRRGARHRRRSGSARCAWSPPGLASPRAVRRAAGGGLRAWRRRAVWPWPPPPAGG